MNPSQRIVLEHQALITMGGVELVFLLPVFEKPRKCLLHLIDTAFAGVDQTLTNRDISIAILRVYNYYAQKYTGKRGLVNMKQIVRLALVKHLQRSTISSSKTKYLGTVCGKWKQL